MRRYALVAMMLFGASAALAGFQAIGDPQEGGSWYQGFKEDGWYSGVHWNFDTMVIEMVSAGDRFENNAQRSAISGFSGGAGWSMIYANDAVYPTIAVAAGGDAPGLFYTTVQFEGPTSNPLMFNVFIFSDSVFGGGTLCTWSGSAWSFVQSNEAPMLSEFIPAPGAALLGVIGIGLVGRVKRRSS